MHRVHPVATFHLHGRHGTPAAFRGQPPRQVQVVLHMIHLPQGQRDSRGEEVSETRGQTAQLETYPVAIELDGAVEVLDQKTYVADGLSHGSAWKCSPRRECQWANGRSLSSRGCRSGHLPFHARYGRQK